MNIMLNGILRHSGGYSELTRNLAVVLNDLGVLVGISCRDQHNFQQMPLDTFCSEEYIKLEAMVKARESEFYKKTPDTLLQMCPPFMFLPAPPGSKSIGITMFETRVPQDWLKYVNTLDQLWIHDHYQSELFAGYSKPTGLWEPYVSNPMDTVVNGGDGSNFKYVLAVGVARVHKNQSKIIQAFQNIKKHLYNYKLIIKSITEDLEGDDYRDMVRGDPDIIVYPGTFSTLAMDKLYRFCSVFVSASMCEGLDMPAIKAAMCRKPIVMTGRTGQTDWMPSSGFQVMQSTITDMSNIPNIHPRYREAGMMGYDVTVEELENHMMAAITNPESYMIDIAQRFSRKSCMESVDKLLKTMS